MSHNLPTKIVPTLPGSSFVPTPRFLRALDLYASQSVNGDDGGLWTPKTPLIIGGAGVAMSAAGGFTGGVRTGARAPAGPLVLGASDWPTYSAPRTLAVLFHLVDRSSAIVDSIGSTSYDDSSPGSIKESTGGLIAITPLDTKHFPQGATIASVEFRFRVGTRPASVPGSLPRILFTTFNSAGTLLSDSQTLPAPANVDAYYNNGLPQSIVLTPVNNTVVSPSLIYTFSLSDPTSTSNVAHSVMITFTAADLRANL